MIQQLLVEPLTKKAAEQPSDTGTDELEANTPLDFEYRPIPPSHVLTVRARIKTISAGKPMRYDLISEE